MLKLCCSLTPTFPLLMVDFTLVKSGPYLGASPDGLVSFSCCGNRICEVKCPYCIADSRANTDVASRKHSCLTGRSGHLQLNRGHASFYQVQCQINVPGVLYSDFIIWNSNDIFIKWILPDNELCDSIIIRSEDFFKNAYFLKFLANHFLTTKLCKVLNVKGKEQRRRKSNS